MSRAKWTIPRVVKTQHSQVSYYIPPNIFLITPFAVLFIFGCIISLSMGWVDSRVRRPAIKALVLVSYLLVGQVAQFGNWAYSAKQNKRHPRSPSGTVVNYSGATL